MAGPIASRIYLNGSCRLTPLGGTIFHVKRKVGTTNFVHLYFAIGVYATSAIIWTTQTYVVSLVRSAFLFWAIG